MKKKLRSMGLSVHGVHFPQMPGCPGQASWIFSSSWTGQRPRPSPPHSACDYLYPAGKLGGDHFLHQLHTPRFSSCPGRNTYSQYTGVFPKKSTFLNTLPGMQEEKRGVWRGCFQRSAHLSERNSLYGQRIGFWQAYREDLIPYACFWYCWSSVGFLPKDLIAAYSSRLLKSQLLLQSPFLHFTGNAFQGNPPGVRTVPIWRRLIPGTGSAIPFCPVPGNRSTKGRCAICFGRQKIK